jgi:hypothetical protein
MKKLFSMLFGLFFSLTVFSQTVVFHENFESPSNGDSVVSSGTPFAWSINSRIAAGGSQCDSNYVQTTDTSYLTTNIINCAGYPYVVLRFSHICKIEILDGAEIEVSINNGVWTKLTGTQYINPGNSQFVNQGNKFNVLEYVTPDVWSWATGNAKPLNSWWMPELFDLSALAGNQANVRIRFVLRDGNGTGASSHHGWFIDNINVIGATTELIPPTIAYKTPILQDTVFNTGPFDIYAYIKDLSGIDTAWVTYTVNGGSNNYVPMLWVSDSTYKATIPSYSWNNSISYYVHAVDNSLSHNAATAATKTFYIKQGPSDVIIGTGTNTTNNYYPFYNRYENNRTQMLYKASEINKSGSITHLAFDISYVTADITKRHLLNFVIKIKQTAINTLGTAYEDMTTATTVFSSADYNLITAAGWHNFDITDYAYNGTSNLIVEIVWGDNGAYTISGDQYNVNRTDYTAGSDVLVVYGYSDAETPPTYDGNSKLRPNIRLTFPVTNFHADAGVKQIVNPTANTLANVAVPVDITIKNYAVDSLKKVTIEWKVDGVLQTPFAWTGGLPAGVTSSSFNVGSINVPVGSHTLKLWTANPNDSIDHDHSNDTISMSIFACTGTLAGNYTVGGGGADFATFADVFTGLTNCGISAPVTFLINSGTYNEQLTFNPITGSSAINTVTFKPNVGATVTITNNSTTSTIKFNGADNIIFDGSNNSGLSRDMTISNTSILASTAVIQFASLGAAAGATNDWIKNCIITAGSNTVTTYGISIGAAIGAAGADNDGIMISNNVINKAYYGIYAVATAANVNDNLSLINNSIGSATVADYIRYCGIYLSYGGGILRGNTIYNIITTATTPIGININTGFVNAEINKNNINNITYTGTGGYGGRGIYVNTGNASSNLLIDNNMISAIGGDGWTTFAGSSMVGMYFDGTTGGLNIYYNSVYMNGTFARASATLTTAILFNTATITAVNLRNNIFENTMNNTSVTTDKNYAIYSTAANTSFTNINFNDYYVTGAEGVLGYLTSDRTTLAAWRTATVQDVNSVNVNPSFTSTTNLHTFSNSVNNIATPIALVTEDFDQEIRDVSTPDIGADEFTPLTDDIGLLSIIAPVSGCGYTNAEQIKMRFKNFGGNTIYSADMYYKLNNGTPVHEVFSGNVSPDSSFTYTFTTTADLSAPGNYTIKTYVDLLNDNNNLNDTLNRQFYSGYNFGLGAYTMGFESTDDMSSWTKLDVNADSRTWEFPYIGYPHSGSNSARFYNGTTNPGNDWLFSRCFSLAAGNTYKIEYWYRVESASYTESIDLKVGSAATPGAMTTTLISMPALTNTTYQKATITYTPSTSGTYYFGWYAYSPASNFYAFIDDINISLVPNQEATALSLSTPNTGCGLTSAEVVTLQIKNTGAQIINGNLTAYYKVNNGSTFSEAVSASIPVGDTLDFVFTAPINMAVTTYDSLFAIKSWVVLTGDPFSYNDSVQSDVHSYHIPADPTVIGDTIPYGGIATLHANSADSIYWYSVPTGGTSIGAGSTYVTSNLYVSTIYYVEARSGAPNLKITEVTQYSTGTGATSPYPSWLTAGDWDGIEVTNLGSATADLTGYTAHIEGPATIDYTIPAGVTLDPGEVMILTRYGFAADDPVHKLYVMSTSGSTSSGVQNGYYLKNASGTVVDAIATDGYSFSAGSGVTALDWSGNIGSSSGLAGVIRTVSDNNNASDWSLASVSVHQTMGSLNPTLTIGSGGGGCASSRVPDTAKVVLLGYEAGIVGMPDPIGGCSYGPENITIRVRNNGDSTIHTFNAKYIAATNPVVTEVVNTTLLPGDTLNYTFTTAINPGVTQLNQDTTIHITAWIELVNDIYHINDTTEADVAFLYSPPDPVVSNVTIPYGTSTTLTAVSSDSLYWFDVPTGGTEIGQGAYTTPILYSNTVYYVEARSGSPSSGLKITEINIGTDDYIEIQNVSGNTIDATGYVVALSNSYSDINSVNANLWNLSSIVAGQVLVKNDISSSPDYWGSNIMWNPGAFPSFSGWAMILDPAGTIVDYVAWGWPQTNIQSFAATINSHPVTIGTEWIGNGITGPTNDFVVRTNSDANESTDWINSTTGTIGSANPGMTVTAGGSGCPSARIPDTVFISGAPACDVGVNMIYSPVSGIELTNSETVIARVKNYGTSPASNIPINYTINGGALVTEMIAGPIASNDTLLYTFTNGADLSLFDTYTIDVFTTLGCDATKVNDTSSVIVVNNPLAYCTSSATSTIDDDIGNVTFGGINNGTGTPILSNPDAVHTYSDFTSLPPATIIAGSNEPISVTQIEDDLGWYDCLVNVYIDYNHNGTFDLPAEKVFSAATGTDYNFPTVTGNVNVPTTGIVTGVPSLMRVVLDESDVAPPCGTYTWGETEDYMIILLPQIPLDAGVTNIIQPLANQNEGDNIPVGVIVKNFGLDTIKNTDNMSLEYSLNGLPAVTTLWAGGQLLPGATDTVTLPNIIVPAGNNDICAWTVLAPDINFANDTFCKGFFGNPSFDAGVSLIIQPLTLNGFEGAVQAVEVQITNFGSDTLTSIPVSYSVNGVITATQTWSGVLLPGQIDTLLFTQSYIIPAGTYDLCANTAIPVDGNHSNDTICISPYGLFTSTIPYYDNFDGNVYWTQTDNGAGSIWELGSPSYGVTNSTHSAPNAWDINLSTAYTNSASAVLYTQNFDFSTVVSAKMKFWLNYYLEGTTTFYDGMRIDYTIDSGNTWNVLGSMNDPQGVNWYVTNNITSSSKPGWGGNSGGWQHSEYSLDTLNGVPSVRFRFVFTTDGSGILDGISVDDFSIIIPSPIDAGVEQIKTPAVQASAGSQKMVKVLIHNFGTDTLTSIPVAYAANGGIPVHATWTGQLLPNDTITYTFTTQLTVPGGMFDLCSYTEVPGDGDNLNDTTCTSITGVMTFVVPWSDDMEGTVYWFAEGANSSWEYGVPASATINTAHSPTHCWKTNLDGYYMNSAIDYLYTPYFSFTQVNDATLDFWHWYQTESNLDGGKIEYSINGGPWLTLGLVGDPAATNWYTTNISGSPYWSGNSSGWVHSTFNLSTIPTIVNATTPVQFRYKFMSSASGNSYDGWAVDDFALIAPPIAKDAGVTVVITPSGSTVTGSSVTVQVTIENFGTDSLHTIPVAYNINGGTITQETWTGVLQPGNTINYTFATSFTSPAATYDLCAFTKRSGDIYLFNDTTCVGINATPAPDDAGVDSILAPGLSTIYLDSIQVQVRIHNYGSNALTSIPVRYNRNGVTVATATWTGNLAGGATTIYTFAQKYISPISNYALCAFTMLPGDANSGNDQKCINPVGVIGMDEYSGNGFYLWQNVPNPSDNLTYIQYQIPSDGKVTFEIRDLLGQIINSQQSEAKAGLNRIEISTLKMSTGVYYYSVTFDGQRLTKKMVVTK